MQRFLLIDSSVYIFRSYFALQPLWQSQCGNATEAVYGFTAYLIKLLAQEAPDYIAAAFDESLGSGFRHQLYPAYKSNRALPDQSLAFQLEACKTVAGCLGIKTVASDVYEADDLIAALSEHRGHGLCCDIVSRDKDLAQLLEDGVRLWDYGYGEPVDGVRYRQQTGLEPAWVVDYLAMVGDASDAIPGVPGIGPKTATAILTECGPVAHWIDRPHQLATVAVRGAAKLPDKISAHTEQLKRNLQLITLRRDAKPAPSTAECRWSGIDLAETKDHFTRLGIHSLLNRAVKLKIAS